ncbi:MAG: fatty-acid--CoA ligase [Betaproteobacteria bacterium]|nr:fatty-acid--CoA ligase [Betaproteobacteria bacterium]
MAQWHAQTLADALTRSAELLPAQEALVIGDARLTYGELSTRVDETARGLRVLGIRRGDHVAVCMGNTVEWAVFFYAAASIGAVTVPVNTRFKPDELAYCLKQADVKVLFVADRFLKIDFIGMLRQVCPGIDHALPDPALPKLENVVVLGSDVPKAAIRLAEMLALGEIHDEPVFDDVTPGDVLLMQFTSGTTSYPKGVMLTHDNMLRNAAYVAERFDLKQGDRYYSARPFYHVAGTTLSLLAALTVGACLLSSESFDPGVALRIMSDESCTHTSGNDTMFLMLLGRPDFDQYPLKLRGGWASAGAEVSRKIVGRMGMTGLCQAYGLSEASPNVCMSWHDDDLEKRIDGWAHVLEGLDVSISDPETGKELPPGATGEIVLRGWSVMKGYYKMPEQTARAIDRDGWLHTGDYGVMDEDGRLRFVSRIKDVFRVGGENVAPAEVEDVLHRHPKVKQAQVIGVPDTRLIEVPAAYLILKEGEHATSDEIIEWSRTRMANFRVPRYVKIVDTFENIGMTGSAKVQKNKLRAQALIDFGLETKT